MARPERQLADSGDGKSLRFAVFLFSNGEIVCKCCMMIVSVQEDSVAALHKQNKVVKGAKAVLAISFHLKAFSLLRCSNDDLDNNFLLNSCAINFCFKTKTPRR